MATQADAIATYLAELTVVEDDVLRHARERAAVGGMPPVSADSGAFLRFAARWVGAQAAVEIGLGRRVLRGYGSPAGLRPRASSRPSRPTPAISGWPRRPTRRPPSSSRIRAILGRALDVLPRLTDGGYDLAFLDARSPSTPSTWSTRCAWSGRAG